MKNTPTDKAAYIMRHYGADEQLTILCEECSELIKEACKCHRRGVAMHEDMIEEMADVKIMLMQFESIMRTAELDLLNQIMSEKIERQLMRIKNEEVRDGVDE